MPTLSLSCLEKDPLGWDGAQWWSAASGCAAPSSIPALQKREGLLLSTAPEDEGGRGPEGERGKVKVTMEEEEEVGGMRKASG